MMPDDHQPSPTLPTDEDVPQPAPTDPSARWDPPAHEGAISHSVDRGPTPSAYESPTYAAVADINGDPVVEDEPYGPEHVDFTGDLEYPVVTGDEDEDETTDDEDDDD